MSSKIFIAIVCHKPPDLRQYPECYYKVLAGSALNANTKVFQANNDFDYYDDSFIDNISNLNKSFCELTVQYWMYKNIAANILGIVHYRRFFKDGELASINEILSCERLSSIMSEYDIIVPTKRNYFPFTIYRHYKIQHFSEDIDLLSKIIEELCPDYVSSFKMVMKGHSLHLYNMFIAKRAVFKEYSEWVFPILFKLYSCNLHTDRNSFQSRVYGFLGERLFNVWLFHNKSRLKIKTLPVLSVKVKSETVKIINFLSNFVTRSKAK
ncbi:MAG: DUF4422 domain-containing protein [Bacteroidetes bacterium]|nr:DUF4422 domain-containing protein [Bacteroidota bacterium]